MGCEVADRVAEWQILGKKWQICSFFGLFCIPTHPFCCCRLHGRPLCSLWEASGFHAVDHRFLAWKPLFSDVQTDGFRRTNRWIPLNKPQGSAEQTAGIRRIKDQFLVDCCRRSQWGLWVMREKLEKRCAYEAFCAESVTLSPHLSPYLSPTKHALCQSVKTIWWQSDRFFREKFFW